MADKSPTPILLDTEILSRIVSDVLETAGAPSSKKSACLNKVAARVVGDRKNWGFLKGRDEPVVAHGITGYGVVAAPEAPKDPSVVSPAAYPAALRVGLVTKKRVMLVSGPPGVGLCNTIIEMAEQMRCRHLTIRAAILREDEMLDWHNNARLNSEFRPLSGADDYTIYDEVDGLNDEGLAALEAELDLLAEQQPSAQVFLVTNFPDRLIPRLRRVAPKLLARAFPIQVDAPMPDALKEFIAAQPAMMEKTLPHLQDTPMPTLPSHASWDRAGEIMRRAQPGVDALREASAITRSAVKVQASEPFEPLVEVGSLEELLAFMEGKEELSSRVISYIRDHAQTVEADLKSHAVPARSWQEAARLVDLYEEAAENGTWQRKKLHADLLRRYAEMRLGAHGAKLLGELGL